jgi:predicted nucleic acid-binding protein
VPVFVDTNVLVYARDETEGGKQLRAAAWLEHLWRTRNGRLSYQVLQEFYVTVTAKLRPGLSTGEARSDVRAFLAWRPMAVDERVLEDAWSEQDHNQLSFWDALIVAAARATGCDRLLTEDLADGTSYGDIVVVDPFAHEPED